MCMCVCVSVYCFFCCCCCCYCCLGFVVVAVCCFVCCCYCCLYSSSKRTSRKYRVKKLTGFLENFRYLFSLKSRRHWLWWWWSFFFLFSSVVGCADCVVQGCTILAFEQRLIVRYRVSCLWSCRRYDARRCTLSSSWVSFCLWGSQTVDAYSSVP